MLSFTPYQMSKLIFISITFSLVCVGQEYSEQWNYVTSTQEEQVNLELIEVWEHYNQNPINLLDSIEINKLNELNLLTDKEIEIIKIYCKTQKLISSYQLQTLDISLEKLRLIKDFIYVPSTKSSEYLSKKFILHMGLQRQFPPRRGTIDNTFLGSPYKTNLRFRNNFNQKWAYGISWEKDIGEPLWYPEGANNLAINFVFKGKKQLKKVLIGKYDISIGEGLLFGTSYRLNNPYFLNYNPKSVTKSILSSKEYNYFSGIATQWKLRTVHIDVFASHRKLHGNSSIDKSGLFRTTKEITYRKNIQENLFGVHLSKKQSTLSWAGIVYQSDLKSEQNHFIQSIYWCKNYYNLNLSGELSLEDFSHWAVLQKLNTSIGNNSMLSIQFRNRKDGVFNEYRSDYSSFSNGYENGFYYAFQHFFNEKWKFQLAFDHFTSNSIKNSPPYFPAGNKTYSSLSRSTDQRKILLQYKYKKIDLSKPINSYRLFYQENPSEQFRWNSIVKIIEAEKKINSSLQLNMYYKSINQKSSINLSHTLFHTQNESIYWQAPFFLGNYNARFLNGKGNTSSLSYQKKIDRTLKIGAQATQITYFDRLEIGTGNELIENNSKLELSLYLRWKN